MANKNNMPNNRKYKGESKAQILLISILITIAMLLLYTNSYQTTINISEHKFEEMMKEGDVKKVIFVTNKNLVEVFLNERAINKEDYKKEFAKYGANLNSGAAHYYFKALSPEIFNSNFKNLELQLSPDKRIGYITKEKIEPLNLFINWSPLLILLFIFFLIMRKATGGIGQFNIGKSQASLFDAKNSIKVTFNDVAGLAEAKEELKEIVDFLKSPGKFTTLGGKIPKGALLIGAPGTGKTLLAKAVAGEANVPFFSLSGSDFVEMFVGVGAARVRDLFKKAKAKAPCIIFIDEIDAVGRSRSRVQMPSSNDERENTLNSLLVEMDGFGNNAGIIILAATNRPDVLDAALLRPGRFDRQISIDKPDIIGREEIFKLYLKSLKVEPTIQAKKLAEQTPGFAGAEIANVCNEAALIAARKDKKEIDMQDFQDSIDRVIGGLEKKGKIISPNEKKIISYHEAGHAVAGWLLEHADPLVKVSIVPRGLAALGYAQYLPKERFLYQKETLLDSMRMALGGRAAEEIIFGKISTGAVEDLERITKMAYSMVTIYGMNEKIGTMSFQDSKQDQTYSFTKPYSEHTAQEIDKEVRTLIKEQYEYVKNLLLDNKEKLELLAKELLKKEVIFQADIEEIIGKRPYAAENEIILEESK
jgi:AFG3 family protein